MITQASATVVCLLHDQALVPTGGAFVSLFLLDSGVNVGQVHGSTQYKMKYPNWIEKNLL